MSTSSDIQTITMLNNILTQTNRYFAPLILLFGFSGNLLNILVLSQQTLRTNSCAWLFLLSSITDLISIFFGLLTRILSGWNLDFTMTITWLCQFRTFIVFSFRTMALWFLMFASIDRWFSSSTNANYRQISSLKNAQKCSILIIILSFLLYLHMFYCYEANLLYTPLSCYDKTVECRYTTDIIYGFLTVLFPLILMIIFGLMTILNIRKIQSRLQPMNISQINLNDNPIHRRKKVDHHLLRMLFIQIFLLSFLIFPQAIQKLYSTFTFQLNKTTLEYTIDNFLYSCLLLLAYIACGMSFYFNILCGGKIFRDAFFNIPKFICRHEFRSFNI